MITLTPIRDFIRYHSPKHVYRRLTNYELKENKKLIQINKDRFNKLNEILNDNFSKDVLKAVISYRTTLDKNYLSEVGDVEFEQYFDKCLIFSKNETFIDCGGYIGDTTKNFILRNPKYEKIIIYEPIKSHFKICQRYFNNNQNIILKNNCCGKENKLVKMAQDDVSSHVSKTGSEFVHMIKLDDDLLNIHPTFIKMDIEGFELDALKGMTRILKEEKPKLAICVYHKPMDILEIPEFIKSINPNYKLALRQYIHRLKSDTELVLYAY